MQQELRPGTTLRNNTYRIVRTLGQGGFGITYLAVDITLDRQVAIKEFFPKDYCDRDGSTSHVTLGTQSASQFVTKLKAKFLKEAKNIAKFDNPGIIRIHAAFEENNTTYYVMDYIEGESLAEMVKRDGSFPERTALRYITKVGQALEYVHAHRINHLDVKPANIMVRKSDDEPILIDFGLSKQYDFEGNHTSTTPTGISHGFAPLEQYNDVGVKEFSPQTDLYSLAATLYYILSGVTPPQATLLVDEELTFPTEIPRRLVRPIAKAMAVTRRNRQESIAKFLAELAKEPEATPKPHGSKQLKPDKKWWILGAATAVIVLAVSLWPKSESANAAADISDSTLAVADSVKTVVDLDKPISDSVKTGVNSVKEATETAPVDMNPEELYGKGEAEYKLKNYEAASKWYRKAAEQDYAPAQSKLAYMYNFGEGVKRNYNEALKLYRKAAEKAYAPAQCGIGYMYQWGEGVGVDYNEAVKWYRKAVDQGDAQGQIALGYMYYQGLGVKESLSEGMKLYRKAAEQGYAPGQVALGFMYENVFEKYDEAIKWYRKAADQNNPEAQAYIGRMYEKGHGVKKDISEALKWYRKAAKQGNRDAEVALKELGEKTGMQ